MKHIRHFLTSTSGSMAQELVFALPVVALLTAGSQVMAERTIETGATRTLSIFALLTPATAGSVLPE